MLLHNKNGIEKIVNIDNEGYGSAKSNLKDIAGDRRYSYLKANIASSDDLRQVFDSVDIDTIVNFAAETHVDRSISNPSSFFDSNIRGCFNLLELSRLNDVETFVQVSTDEVYGDITGKQNVDEAAPLEPNSPYSASKASADLLVRSYTSTYGLKAMITRSSNNFGSNQFPEKLIPKAIIRSLNNLSIPVYGDGKQIREWIFVVDNAEAILSVIENGHPGEIYNISASNAMSNIDLINKIGNLLLQKTGTRIKIEYVSDRPGHDKRYALDSSKIKDQLGWQPKHPFEEALSSTIDWYLANDWWWKPLLSQQVLHPEPWKLTW
jgi:dTDP-glucose 4,6-dehydratase